MPNKAGFSFNHELPCMHLNPVRKRTVGCREGVATVSAVPWVLLTVVESQQFCFGQGNDGDLPDPDCSCAIAAGVLWLGKRWDFLMPDTPAASARRREAVVSGWWLVARGRAKERNLKIENGNSKLENRKSPITNG